MILMRRMIGVVPVLMCVFENLLVFFTQLLVVLRVGVLMRMLALSAMMTLFLDQPRSAFGLLTNDLRTYRRHVELMSFIVHERL